MKKWNYPDPGKPLRDLRGEERHGNEAGCRCESLNAFGAGGAAITARLVNPASDTGSMAIVTTAARSATGSIGRTMNRCGRSQFGASTK